MSTRPDFAEGLRLAASMVADYGHAVERSALVPIQAAILRAAAIAECDGCNRSGAAMNDQGRVIDHHPIDAEAAAAVQPATRTAMSHYRTRANRAQADANAWGALADELEAFANERAGHHPDQGALL